MDLGPVPGRLATGRPVSPLTLDLVLGQRFEEGHDAAAEIGVERAVIGADEVSQIVLRQGHRRPER